MTITRKNKIIVAVALTKDARDSLLERVLSDAGFARIPSDARKLISRSIQDVDLDGCFFVAAADYRFGYSDLINQRLIRMAMQGIPVFISAKIIPNHYLQFCEVIYPEL